MAKHYPKSRSKTTSHRNKTREPQQVTEQELQQDLLELVARAERAKTLTAMVTLVMVSLRVLGLKLVRMAMEHRDEQMHRGRQGAPCCPRCGRKLHRPKRKWTTRVTLLGKLRYRRRSWLCARCHAVSYLWKVAKKWKRGNRKKDVQAREKWVDGLVVYLANGQVANVIQRLQRLQRGKSGGLFDEIRRIPAYRIPRG